MEALALAENEKVELLNANEKLNALLNAQKEVLNTNNNASEQLVLITNQNAELLDSNKKMADELSIAKQESGGLLDSNKALAEELLLAKNERLGVHDTSFSQSSVEELVLAQQQIDTLLVTNQQIFAELTVAQNELPLLKATIQNIIETKDSEHSIHVDHLTHASQILTGHLERQLKVADTVRTQLEQEITHLRQLLKEDSLLHVREIVSLKVQLQDQPAEPYGFKQLIQHCDKTSNNYIHELRNVKQLLTDLVRSYTPGISNDLSFSSLVKTIRIQLETQVQDQQSEIHFSQTRLQLIDQNQVDKMVSLEEQPLVVPVLHSASASISAITCAAFESEILVNDMVTLEQHMVAITTLQTELEQQAIIHSLEVAKMQQEFTGQSLIKNVEIQGLINQSHDFIEETNALRVQLCNYEMALNDNEAELAQLVKVFFFTYNIK